MGRKHGYGGIHILLASTRADIGGVGKGSGEAEVVAVGNTFS